MTNRNAKKEIIEPLELASQAFENWRATKTRRVQRVPDELRALINELIPQYGIATVLKKLKLKAPDVKKYLNQEVKIKNKKLQFVECLQPLWPIEPDRVKLCSIEFSCKNASDIKLSGLSGIEIQQIVTLLIGHL